MFKSAQTLILSTLIALLVLGTSCKPPAAEEPPGKEPVLVRSTRVEVTDLSTYREVSNPIEALRQVAYSAEIGGQLDELYFENGQTVTEGQTILEIDHREIDLQIRQLASQIRAAEAGLRKLRNLARPQELQQAQSQLESAEANFTAASEDYDRAKTLKKEGVFSQSQLDAADARFESAKAARDASREALDLLKEGARAEDLIGAEAELDSLKSSLELARVQLDKAIIEAEFSGKIAGLNIDEGELVSMGMPLFTLMDDSGFLLKVGLSDREIGVVKVGDTLDITADALPKVIFKGTISSVSVLADRMTHTYPVEIRVPADPRLRAGMVASARIEIERMENVLALPLACVMERGGEFYVFHPENGLALKRIVEIGMQSEGLVRIVSGLKVGDEALSLGHKDLRDGDPIVLDEASGES